MFTHRMRMKWLNNNTNTLCYSGACYWKHMQQKKKIITLVSYTYWHSIFLPIVTKREFNVVAVESNCCLLDFCYMYIENQLLLIIFHRNCSSAKLFKVTEQNIVNQNTNTIWIIEWYFSWKWCSKFILLIGIWIKWTEHAFGCCQIESRTLSKSDFASYLKRIQFKV